MKKAATTLLSAVVAAAVWAGATTAVRAHERAQGHRGHIGFYLGSPWVWGPYPYFPPVTVYAEPAAHLYVQAAPQAYAGPQSAYWYYCPDAGAYYPYVQTCPSGWMQVIPRNR